MKLYVANRSEIASRIIRSAKKLKIPSFVGYCQEDSDLPFVQEASRSKKIECHQATEAYLNADLVLSTAKSLGATHLHPGYGFLSENADFVRRLEKEGIKFIGPPASAIEKLGDKIGSRNFLKKIDVPLLPSYEGDNQSEDYLFEQAKSIGFPLLIKPSAGGGGKGMELVRSEEEFSEALRSSFRVAESAFGDRRVFLERYIENARHVEVQILADEACEVRAIGERECSLQRRHQKLIEECPCIFLPEDLRQKMLKKSVEIASAVGYVSAGTVEWIWDGQSGLYFLEVNTRLQVEHPVTEMVYGLDLVEWQLRIAQGESLSNLPELSPKGHSIEVRVCAEDPEKDFLPTGGRIHRLRFPDDTRVDFGYREGNRVGSQFDSMLGKLIVYARNREEALQKTVESLENLILLGPKTNRAYLLQVIQQKRVQDGELSTKFLSEFRYQLDLQKAFKALRSLREGPSSSRAALVSEEEDCDWYSPWGRLSREDSSSFFEDFEGKRYYFFPFADWSEKLERQRLDQKASLGEESQAPEIFSPMPAKVVQLLVSEGEEVGAGQVLMILEAMKMEHKIRAPFHASVQELKVSLHEQVDGEQCLLVLRPKDQPIVEGANS